MGLLGATHGWGGRPTLPKICHTYPTMMKLGTLIPSLKKNQKTYKSRDTSLEFCWHQHFFTGSRQILLYQEIQIQIASWYIISDSFQIFLKKHGYNFDDVSKTGYSRPSWNKGILKYRLWRHNFCLWRHQQNFIMWLNLYCKCGHVTKVW